MGVPDSEQEPWRFCDLEKMITPVKARCKVLGRSGKNGGRKKNGGKNLGDKQNDGHIVGQFSSAVAIMAMSAIPWLFRRSKKVNLSQLTPPQTRVSFGLNVYDFLRKGNQAPSRLPSTDLRREHQEMLSETRLDSCFCCLQICRLCSTPIDCLHFYICARCRRGSRPCTCGAR